ncbi:Rho/RAC guanine nucleotide exchange factor, putative [Entamoeba invadens IP1]|uniref:Rho/RAC guanine nucleotide exchange factor, putative n=1 Tax=Entamoeba invadens IP1 TaxID=370355 RepID=A0A0A1TZ30_ENTIV|nr:Rho/RAC guanine nucleotide exchange factor, putative [Entamoeba invadens IP1]ELP84980.1 Rho/RAC guanine nucleotide exchange factor, putative [Entamoeba invadens IP1]|eukprot:XP_004184326.1 Rho/RAC guanine nucleotide exchange factor, putative [Entamoeba invadens IP1]
MNKREHILNEIYNTEESYLKSLQTCQIIYYDDMTTRIPPIVELDDSEEIFRFLDSIISVSTSMMKDFAEAKKSNRFSEDLGRIFIKMQPYLKVYNMYVANNAYALNEVENLNKDEKCADYLEQLRNSIEGPESTKLDLNSFLIMPVQRVPRYRLLLEDLLKNTPDGTEGKNEIKVALDQIKELALSVNESIADEQRRHNLLKIRNRLPKEQQQFFIRPWRKFVLETQVDLLFKDKHNKLTFVFLTDILMFTNAEKEKLKLFAVFTVGKLEKAVMKGDKIVVVSFKEPKQESDQIETLEITFLDAANAKKSFDALTPLLVSEKERIKTIKLRQNDDDCPCCRKYLNRFGCNSKICEKCNKKVCGVCAMTKIALVAGGSLRTVCDACLLAMYTKQQEALSKPRVKKAPLQLKKNGPKIIEAPQMYQETTQTQQQVLPQGVLFNPMLFNTPVFNQNSQIYQPINLYQNPQYVNMQTSQMGIQQYPQQSLQNTQTQTSQTDLLKSLHVPQKRRPQK